MTQLRLPGDAQASHVLEDSTFSSQTFYKAKGTMKNKSGKEVPATSRVISGTLALSITEDAYLDSTSTLVVPNANVRAEVILPGKDIVGVYGKAPRPGRAWTVTTPAAANNWTAVCYGHGRYVAVSSTGSGNRVMTSEDGETWTSRASASNSNWTSVCYGEGIFVAVGTDASMTSRDGITWFTRAMIPGNWTSVCYGQGKFVAACSVDAANEKFAISTEGTTWYEANQASDLYAPKFTSICYGDDDFYVAMLKSSSEYMYSSDGENWSLSSFPRTAAVQSICYGRGKYVAVCLESTNNLYSLPSPGGSWVAGSPVSGGTVWTSVAYGEGMFIAVGNYPGGGSTGNWAMSKDGVSWTVYSGTIPKTYNAICFGNGRFVAVGPSVSGIS